MNPVKSTLRGVLIAEGGNVSPRSCMPGSRAMLIVHVIQRHPSKAINRDWIAPSTGANIISSPGEAAIAKFDTLTCEN